MPASSRRLAELTFSLLLFVTALAISSLAAAADKPPVRAITAFIDLDPARYEEQVEDTANRLRRASAVFQKAGYEVQTVRITTQPYPRYVRGMSKEQALKLLSDLAALGRKQSVIINIGPAVMTDEPDPAMLELLEALHSGPKRLDASMIVASESGVHWNTVRAAARHIYRVAQKSPRSQGTFNFAATAMLAPGAPFYPGSYHVREGGRFSIGLQSPSVVARAFAAAKGDASEATRLLRAAFVAEAAQDMARDVERALPRQPLLAIDEIAERLTLEHLHHQVERAVVGLAEVVDADAVGVADLAADERLALEPLARLGAAAQPRVQHLDRDGLADPDVLAAVDRAHPARADLGVDPVAALQHAPDQRVDGPER